MNTRAFASRPARAHGFSLIEVLLVVAVLSVAGLVILPSMTTSETYKLELAASEVAAAYRYARGEALRGADPHGVHVDVAQNRIRLFRLPTLSPPTPAYDVNHPLTKRLYDIDLDAQPATEGVTVASGAVWSATCDQPSFFGFDSAGTPRCGDPWPVTLEVGGVMLSYQGHTRAVVVDGETGRVTVQ